MTITDLIARVKALDAKATKGPWRIEKCYELRDVHWAVVDPDDESRVASLGLIFEDSFSNEVRPEWDFISSARTLLPLMARLLEIYERYAVDGLDRWDWEALHAELAAALEEAK